MISSRVGAASEVIISGSNGYIIDVEDEAALAEHIEKLVADATLREEIGRAGRRTFEARLTQERYRDEILAVLDQFISRPLADPRASQPGSDTA